MNTEPIVVDAIKKNKELKWGSMRGSRQFCQRESTFDNDFSWLGGTDPYTTISGPLSSRQRNAIEMVFRWRADVGPTLNTVIFQRIRTSIAKKPYIFCDF